jgi:cytochrome b
VWDLPVRISHWVVVACVAVAWLTRDSRLIDLHAAAGYCALLLLAFRVIWGFVGTRHARFSDFAYSAGSAIGYLRELVRGAPRHYTGHNPAGSWSVYGLLAGIGLVGLSGIVAIGAMFAMGPLPGMADAPTADNALEIHEWLAWALLWLIGAHVLGAIASSVVHRENLVGAMMTGRKAVHGAEEGVTPARAPLAIAILAAIGLFVSIYLHTTGWLDGYSELHARPKPAAAIPAAWQKECSGCHFAYPPALLPLRSWERMLAEQESHFGEDLSLNAASLRQLTADASVVPADPPWAAWKLSHSVPARESPQRITELGFWKRAHRDLPESSFKAPISNGRLDCEACHRDAASGIFHPRMIQKPARRSIL